MQGALLPFQLETSNAWASLSLCSVLLKLQLELSLSQISLVTLTECWGKWQTEIGQVQKSSFGPYYVFVLMK